MKYYIKTFGCQMNFNDSERLRGILRSMGYEPAQSWEEADLILLNTCTIREKPDQKVYSHLGEYKKIKEKKPTALIGVCGCLAQRMGEELAHKAPVVDLMFSSYNMHQLPELISQAQAGYRAIAILEEPPEDEDKLWDFPTVRDNQFCAYVTVMKGCDKNCTYCVVPKTRGRQRSRGLESILEEVRELVQGGVREVHLLGQNVTAWGQDIGLPFEELLYRVAEVPGVERVRFTTGHPKDMTERIARAMGDIPQICEHIHLPLQAGSDRILGLMDRGYVKEEYLEKVQMLREYVKGITFSTDIIVGFPTETEEDFEETLDVLRRVRFEQVFSFKYSPRPDTPAYSMEGQVKEEVKSERMTRLLELQKSIIGDIARSYQNTEQELLLESYEGGKLMGRTRTNRWASLRGEESLLGKVVRAKVTDSRAFSMECELLEVVR
ncbi:MAG: tRNA (N6-isopentenyl adenosine(37)-C2)-methylthiotransferase MiaB [Aquificaceae bacterium]|nr:tRNA (N6-isopentenyl adenosine(37)-C2)-methylthiotransferase MiaB [Aquificaceae bacterium]MCS7195909.1 tRNA (N6-isopentenyl adenosine(37)-C2)-methylthiotransferase MiaB [Aquificaceae bacterium]MDW8032897.1 tRNA (N6-isopentenyl adenosine(37)-C2)-methylthiotransferase MiaB [Aquificaceae bacterium]MDW8294939.1 tRNA (N6-isopentenyl adenosine(37)-C2)-methylthiotransferase MiaB [Aquificaceae bacterium]